jgi:hypothetical protein
MGRGHLLSAARPAGRSVSTGTTTSGHDRRGCGKRAGRSWAPVGQTPVIKGTGKRFRVNMISAISNAGMLRFRLFTGSFTGAVFIDFLGRLLRDCDGRKVHLIVDGHPVHRRSAPGSGAIPTGSSCTSCPATAPS